MDETTFWRLIDESRAAAVAGDRHGSQQRQLAKLSELLSPLTHEELIEFRNRLNYFMDKAFTWDLMGVAYIIGEGAQDDYFNYFQMWLVSMGRDAYERVMKDPETADLIQKLPGVETIFFEELVYVPDRLYKEKTGKRPPAAMSEPARRGPIGKPWSKPEELRERFPRLFAKYNDH